MKVIVNGKVIGSVLTNRSLTLEEAMWALGYDINNAEDCREGYEKGVDGFYIDDNGEYCFDVEAANIVGDDYGEKSWWLIRECENDWYQDNLHTTDREVAKARLYFDWSYLTKAERKNHHYWAAFGEIGEDGFFNYDSITDKIEIEENLDYR